MYKFRKSYHTTKYKGGVIMNKKWIIYIIVGLLVSVSIGIVVYKSFIENNQELQGTEDRSVQMLRRRTVLLYKGSAIHCRFQWRSRLK